MACSWGKEWKTKSSAQSSHWRVGEAHQYVIPQAKVCRRAEGKSDVEMVQWIKVLAASLDKLSLLQGRRGEAAPMSCLLTSADGLRHTFRK